MSNPIDFWLDCASSNRGNIQPTQPSQAHPWAPMTSPQCGASVKSIPVPHMGSNTTSPGCIWAAETIAHATLGCKPRL